MTEVNIQKALGQLALRTSQEDSNVTGHLHLLPVLEVDTPDDSLGTWQRVMEALYPPECRINHLREIVALRDASLTLSKDNLLQLQSRLRRIDRRISDLKEVSTKSAEDVSRQAVLKAIDEFVTLLSLPDVKDLALGDDGEFHLFIEARVEHEGKLYDLGDWEVIFGSPKRQQPDCICRRTGALPEYQESAITREGPETGYIRTPYYYPWRNYYQWPENHFCLNRRRDAVTKALRGGRWLEALITTYEALRSLDGYEIDKYGRTIPSTFVCLGDVPAVP